MGLPLFVAKVDSDLGNKASGKHNVLAPSSGGVQTARNRNRRIYTPDDGLTLRESRWQFEQTRLRRESQRRRARFGHATVGESIQVVAAPSPPAQDYDAVYGIYDDVVDNAMDEFLGLDVQTRSSYADRLQDLLGPRWTQDGLRARARILGLRSARAHAAAFSETVPQFVRNTDPVSSSGGEPRPQRPRGGFLSSHLVPDSGLSLETNRTLRRIIEAMQLDRRRAERALRDRRAAQARTARQQRGIDGLGDRQRSTSPEMWDTLLSTMTPDPEHPSVSSSFASHPTMATQPTNASSFSVPDSEPRAADGFVPEPPCESGCENSDPEDEGTSSRAHATDGRSRPSNLSEGPSARRRPDVNRQRRAPAGSEGAGNTSLGETDSTTPPVSHSPGQYFRVGWVGQLSVGASDERGTRDESSQETNPQAPNTHNEDDWSGMQLIVRRLARREDIPDEWWLEAGLSRTLGDDDAEIQ